MNGSRVRVSICVGLAVVALTGALLAAGPLSQSGYKDEAAECVEEIFLAEAKTWDVLNGVAQSSSSEADIRIEASDVAKAQAAYGENSAALTSAASRLKDLSAPLTCREIDENICAWIELQEEVCMSGYGSIVDEAENGMTYAELADRLDELDRFLRLGNRSVIIGFGSAVKELDVDLSH